MKWKLSSLNLLFALPPEKPQAQYGSHGYPRLNLPRDRILIRQLAIISGLDLLRRRLMRPKAPPVATVDI